MRARAPYAILLLGILGMGALGMATKLAFDSSRELKEVARFKASLLETFSARGVVAVAYRRLPRGGGAALELVVEPEKALGGHSLDADIAELFVERFPRPLSRLELSYRAPSRLGCRRSAPLAERVAPLEAARRRVEKRRERRAVAKALSSLPGVELFRVTREGPDVAVDVVAGGTAGETAEGTAEGTAGGTAGLQGQGWRPERASAFLALVAGRVAAACRTGPGGRVRLRILEPPGAGGAGPGESARVLAEGSFDSRGRPAAPRPE